MAVAEVHGQHGPHSPQTLQSPKEADEATQSSVSPEAKPSSGSTSFCWGIDSKSPRPANASSPSFSTTSPRRSTLATSPQAASATSSRPQKKETRAPFGSAKGRGLLPSSIPTPSRANAECLRQSQEYLKQKRNSVNVGGPEAEPAKAATPPKAAELPMDAAPKSPQKATGAETAAPLPHRESLTVNDAPPPSPEVVSPSPSPQKSERCIVDAAESAPCPHSPEGPMLVIDEALLAPAQGEPEQSDGQQESAAVSTSIEEGAAVSTSSAAGGSRRRNPSLVRYLDAVNKGSGAASAPAPGSEFRLGRSSSVTMLKSNGDEKKQAATRLQRPASPAGMIRPPSSPAGRVRPKSCRSASLLVQVGAAGPARPLFDETTSFIPQSRINKSKAAAVAKEDKAAAKEDRAAAVEPVASVSEAPAVTSSQPSREAGDADAVDEAQSASMTPAGKLEKPMKPTRRITDREPAWGAEGFKAFGLRARAESPMIGQRSRCCKQALDSTIEGNLQACECGNEFFEDDMFCRKCGTKRQLAAAAAPKRQPRADTLPPGSRRTPRATDQHNEGSSRRCNRQSNDTSAAHRSLRQPGQNACRRRQEEGQITKRTTGQRKRSNAVGNSPRQKLIATTPPKDPQTSISPTAEQTQRSSPDSGSGSSGSSELVRDDVSPITLSEQSSDPCSPGQESPGTSSEGRPFDKWFGNWQAWEQESLGEAVASGSTGVPPPPASLRPCTDPGTLFEQFRVSDDMAVIFSTFRHLFRLAVLAPKSGSATADPDAQVLATSVLEPWAQNVRRRPWRFPYEALRVVLGGHWRAKTLWERLDNRCLRAEYSGTPCARGRLSGRHCVIVGAGPAGLRAAIELRLLGARVTVLEKRDKFTRLNRLHLWNWCGEELKAFGARIIEPPPADFGADPDLLHIGISELQLLLMKTALLFGVQVVTGAEYNGVEWSGPGSGWSVLVRNGRASSGEDSGEQLGDVLHIPGVAVVIGAGGLACPVPRSVGIETVEAEFTEAIGMVANFTPLVPRSTVAQQKDRSLRSFSLARQFFESLFKRLADETGADLENIVYTRSKTSHYFVMTPRSKCLAECGVLRDGACKPLLTPANVDQAALDALVRRVVAFHFKEGQASLAEAAAAVGDDALAFADSGPRLFDFSKMKRAADGLAFMPAPVGGAPNGDDDLMVLLAGDSLVEPFWPEGLGIVRGFFGALDAAHAVLLWASGENREKVRMSAAAAYTQLKSLGAASRGAVLREDEASFSTAPSTRYKRINR